MSSALVLGGGGLAGIAWELGLLFGLREAGTPVDDADLVVGTSAGSVVGALVTGGADLAKSFETQLADAVTEKSMDVDLEQLMADEESTAAFGPNPLDAASRAPSARAGRRQAAAASAAVQDLWRN